MVLLFFIVKSSRIVKSVKAIVLQIILYRLKMTENKSIMDMSVLSFNSIILL